MKRLILSLVMSAVAAAPVLGAASDAAAQARRGAPVSVRRGPPPRPVPLPNRNDRRDRDTDDRYDYRAPRPDYYARPSYAPWRRGQILPPAYRGVYVSDYRRYGLRPPPAGYRWYYSNGDYVLAAVATGLIIDLILGLR